MLISSVVGSVGVSLSSFVSSRRTIRINYSPNQWGEEEWKTPFTENSINGWTDYGSQGGKLPKWTLKLLRFHGHISDILWSHETHGIGVIPIESDPCYLRSTYTVLLTQHCGGNCAAQTHKPIPAFIDDAGRGVMTKADNRLEPPQFNSLFWHLGVLKKSTNLAKLHYVLQLILHAAKNELQ